MFKEAIADKELVKCMSNPERELRREGTAQSLLAKANQDNLLKKSTIADCVGKFQDSKGA